MPAAKTYDGEIIYLADLLDRRVEPPKLEGFAFTGCEVYGPAVVYMIEDVRFDHCRFRIGSDPEEMFFEFPAGSVKTGLVGLLNCVFAECTLTGVAVAGSPEALAPLRGAFT
jgi:hypothetical protein